MFNFQRIIVTIIYLDYLGVTYLNMDTDKIEMLIYIFLRGNMALEVGILSFRKKGVIWHHNVKNMIFGLQNKRYKYIKE